MSAAPAYFCVPTDGLEGIVNTVDIPTRATGSKATKTAEAFVRSLIQSSNAEAYISLAQAIADAPVPEYSQIKVPLLCVAGQEDQVAQLEDLALIGDRHALIPQPLPGNSRMHYANFGPVDGVHPPRRSSRFYSEWVTGTALRMQRGWSSA